MKTEWKTLRKATSEDKSINFFAELKLDQVPLTDHVEWTVWTQRIKPDNNYTKNFGWFHDFLDAEECFDDVIAKNPDYKHIVEAF